MQTSCFVLRFSSSDKSPENCCQENGRVITQAVNRCREASIQVDYSSLRSLKVSFSPIQSNWLKNNIVNRTRPFYISNFPTVHCNAYNLKHNLQSQDFLLTIYISYDLCKKKWLQYISVYFDVSVLNPFCQTLAMEILTEKVLTQ